MRKTGTGITMDENAPGFKHFFIAPFIPEDLRWAKGTHDSPYGTIRSQWEKKSEGIVFHIAVPNNSSATMYIPTDDISKILLDDKPLKSRELLTVGEMKSGKIPVELGSGEYVFTVVK